MLHINFFHWLIWFSLHFSDLPNWWGQGRELREVKWLAQDHTAWDVSQLSRKLTHQQFFHFNTVPRQGWGKVITGLNIWGWFQFKQFKLFFCIARPVSKPCVPTFDLETRITADTHGSISGHLLKGYDLSWLGGSISWSTIPYTKVLPVRFPVRAHT